MKLPATALLAVTLLVGCGAPAPEAQPKVETPKPKPPEDESRRFPGEGRVEVEIVEDQLLGKDYLPGGNLASYDREGKQYQQFLIRSDQALDLLSAVKEELADRKFVAAFGGYYGQIDGEGWFVFIKNDYLLGIVGLEQDEADLIARDFAARIY